MTERYPPSALRAGDPDQQAHELGAFGRGGVHIGQRVDGRAHFTGALDEVRVWDRALPDAEITGANAPPGNTVLWLPMDQVVDSR
jgi:hypothetical protein